MQVRKVSPMNKLLIQIIYISLMLFGGVSCQTDTGTKEPTHNSIDNKFIASNTSNNEVLVERTDTLSLIILYPRFSKIDLVCGTMPSQNDTTVLLCAAGSYTGELQETFNHSNIAGDHVSTGRRYRGYSCRRNTGAFVYYNGQWKFLYQDYSEDLNETASHGGCGFAQEMIIHHSDTVPTTRKSSNTNIFRALCQLDGRLCVIESDSTITFGAFKSSLMALKVCEALYMDMGNGWNHAWYRVSNDSVNVLHPKRHNNCTNWITFYRE